MATKHRQHSRHDLGETAAKQHRELRDLQGTVNPLDELGRRLSVRYKLVCFVIAGAFGGLAGALLANHGNYINPSILHWTQSGNLMIMVILGGVGYRYGGLIGALLAQPRADSQKNPTSVHTTHAHPHIHPPMRSLHPHQPNQHPPSPPLPHPPC